MTDYGKPREGTGESFFKKVKDMGNQQRAGVADVDPAEKRKTLLALLLALGILQTLYMNLAAFFPIFSKREYPWIGEGQVGLVLA